MADNSTILNANLHWPSVLMNRNYSTDIAKYKRPEKPHLATEGGSKMRKVDVGGVIVAENANDETQQREEPRIGITISTVVISALVFISILAWTEFLRAWYDNTFVVKDSEFSLVYGRFWYAIFITLIAIIICYIIYKFDYTKE